MIRVVAMSMWKRSYLKSIRKLNGVCRPEVLLHVDQAYCLLVSYKNGLFCRNVDCVLLFNWLTCRPCFFLMNQLQVCVCISVFSRRRGNQELSITKKLCDEIWSQGVRSGTLGIFGGQCLRGLWWGFRRKNDFRFPHSDQTQKSISYWNFIFITRRPLENSFHLYQLLIKASHSLML